jgi:hypothetical protein
MADTVYRVSRWRLALQTVGFIGGVGLSYWLFQYGVMSKSVPWGLLGMIAFAIFAFTHGMQVIVPTRLTLTDQGFVLRHWTALERVAWRDIGPLSVWRVRSTAMIVYTYLPGRLPARLSLLCRINHWSGRFDGSLPGNLPIGDNALCAEMNAWRDRVVPTAEPSPRSG